MKKLVSAVLIAAAVVSTQGAMAHGVGKPKHGGVVASANDLSFELAPVADGAMIYVEDHDEPWSTAGISGKLTVLAGGAKSEAELKSAGENRLHAPGIKLATGATAVAVLQSSTGKPLTVRFKVK